MSTIVIADAGFIPDWVGDRDSFRRWARSDEFPETGTISYIDGSIWVDTSMEQLTTHNRVKSAFTHSIMGILDQTRQGQYVADRWLVDARGPNPSFEILEYSAKGYVAVQATAEGIFSKVFDRSLRLLKRIDPLGNPEFVIEHSTV